MFASLLSQIVAQAANAPGGPSSVHSAPSAAHRRHGAGRSRREPPSGRPGKTPRALALGTVVTFLALGSAGRARADTGAEAGITYADALARASLAAADIASARRSEDVARADVGIAGLLPNPSVSAGTSTQTARLSLGVSVPLVVFGQRGAAVDAARAALATTHVETEVVTADVRAFAAHAFVALWRAQATAGERGRAAVVAHRLEDAVRGRVELGAAPSVDGLRAQAERLRSDADLQQAAQLVSAAGSDLSQWLGVGGGESLRALGDPEVPHPAPLLADLRARVEGSPSLRREGADARAADARADRERALVRPSVVADAGFDFWDDTLCPGGPCSAPPVNYRGTLTMEVPLFNQRGPYVEREVASAAAARARAVALHVRLESAVTSGYRTFEAWTATATALTNGVVPAADAAAAATEESYTLGRAPLVAVLDAERARIDARLALLDARAQQADAWIDVEHALGAR